MNALERLTGFRRLRYADGLDTTLLREHPGRFFVAAGLALQGLDQAAVDTNLAPADGRMLQRLLRMFRNRRPRIAWGLDLGSSSLKAVKLSWDEEQAAAVIEAVDLVEHWKILSQATGELEQQTIIEETLKTFAQLNECAADRVCVGLPGRCLLARHMTLPPMGLEKLDAAVPFEARRLIPFDLDAILWDYAVLGDLEAGPERAQEIDVLLIAAKRAELMHRLTILEELGLHADVVQSECLALYNFWAYDRGDDGPPTPRSPDAMTALVDIGGDATNIVVSGPQFVWFRTVGFGGLSFSRALVQEFKLSYAKAEELKRDPGAADQIRRVHAALEPVMEDLVGEIRQAVQSVTKIRPRSRIAQMYGFGGGFQIHGLLRYLERGP